MLSEKAIFLFMLLILIVAGAAGAVLNSVEIQKEKIKKNNANENINTFEECVAASFPVQESYPRQCKTSGGKHFTEEVEEPVGKIPPVDNRPPVGGCVPAGCSGQLCVEEGLAGEIITTCEYRPEYACLKDAVCERQTSGACGWTETEKSRSCKAQVQNDPVIY